MKKGLKLVLYVFSILLLTISVNNVSAAVTHTVTLVTGTSDIVMEPFIVEDGDTINDKGIDFYPQRVGYAYPEWYLDANFTNEFDFETKIYSDTTLYAKWLISIDEIRITSNITSLTIGEMLPEFSYSSETENVTFGNVSWYSDDEVNISDIVNGEKEYSVYMSAKAMDGYTLDGAKVYFNGVEVSEWIAWPLSMGGSEIGGTFFIPMEVNPSLEIISATDTYVVGESSKAEFEINADYSLFENGGEVFIDGSTTPLDKSNYTSRSGSTIITLNDDYVNTLSAGKHVIKIVFNNDKAAVASFNVTKNTPNTTANNNTENIIQPPHTGINNPKTKDNILLYISMFVLSFVGMAGTIYSKKRVN